jgi:malate dehydrogenase (oxaloacetate-decarboxylating)
MAIDSNPSPSYSLTVRVRLVDRPGSLGRLTTAIGQAGGHIGAIDIVSVVPGVMTRDITIDTSSSEHGEAIVRAMQALDGIEIVNVSDRTFLLHLGGKIEVVSKIPLKTRADLAMAYTPASPGCARRSAGIRRRRSR